MSVFVQKGFASHSFAQMGGRQPLVAVDDARPAGEEETMAVVGRVVAPESSMIASRTTGAVEAAPVRVGDEVMSGDLIIQIDEEPLRIQLDISDAQLLAVESQLTQRRAALNRMSKLRSSTAFQQSNFDDLALEVAELEPRVAEATAKRDAAALELSFAQVTAPFDGVVTVRHTQAGAYIREGEPVVTILDTGALEVEADIPSERVSMDS